MNDFGIWCIGFALIVSYGTVSMIVGVWLKECELERKVKKG